MDTNTISQLFAKITGLTYDVVAVYENASTDEQKDKIAKTIAWAIKRGAAFDVETLKQAKEDGAITEVQQAYLDLVAALDDPADDDEVVTQSDVEYIKTQLDGEEPTTTTTEEPIEEPTTTTTEKPAVEESTTEQTTEEDPTDTANVAGEE